MVLVLFCIITYYTRKATLPLQLEIGASVKDVCEGDLTVEEDLEEEFEGVQRKMKKMLEIKNTIFKEAEVSIVSAQERYKKDYNRKRKLQNVSLYLFICFLQSKFYCTFCFRTILLVLLCYCAIQSVTPGREIKWLQNGWAHMKLLL